VSRLHLRSSYSGRRERIGEEPPPVSPSSFEREPTGVTGRQRGAAPANAANELMLENIGQKIVNNVFSGILDFLQLFASICVFFIHYG
jgi:hypothetical protein